MSPFSKPYPHWLLRVVPDLNYLQNKIQNLLQFTLMTVLVVTAINEISVIREQKLASEYTKIRSLIVQKFSKLSICQACLLQFTHKAFQFCFSGSCFFGVFFHFLFVWVFCLAFLCILISVKISALGVSDNRVSCRKVIRRNRGLFLG